VSVYVLFGCSTVVVIAVIWGNRAGIFPQNLGRVGFWPSYYRVKALLVILGINLGLFIRGAGYSHLMLCIYTIPRSGVITVLQRLCL
jgi:hypothetical protein